MNNVHGDGINCENPPIESFEGRRIADCGTAKTGAGSPRLLASGGNGFNSVIEDQAMWKRIVEVYDAG